MLQFYNPAPERRWRAGARCAMLWRRGRDDATAADAAHASETRSGAVLTVGKGCEGWLSRARGAVKACAAVRAGVVRCEEEVVLLRVRCAHGSGARGGEFGDS